MFYDDDLDTFLDTASFGKSVLFAPNGGTVSTIVGQFFNEYESVNVMGMDAESQIPMIIVKDSDVVGIKHNDHFVIDSISYYVREVKPDGTGLTTVMLSMDTEYTLNYSLLLNGTTQGVTYGNILNSVISGTGQFSFRVWFKLTDYQTCVLGGKYSSTGNKRQFLVNYDNTSETVLCYLSSDGTASNQIVLSSGVKPELNVWYHLVVTVNVSSATSTSKATFYFNSVIATTSVYSTAGTVTSIYSTDASFIAGASAISTNYLKGNICDLAVWNDSITLAEVVEDYNDGIPLEDPSAITGLQLHSTFNNTLNDSSGNGYTATLIGSPSFDADYPLGDLVKFMQQVTYGEYIGNYYKHNSHAQSNFTTSSRYILVCTYVDIYTASADFTVTIYKDGVAHSLITRTGTGVEYHVVDLGDTESKTVRIMPDYSHITSNTFDGIFIQNIIPYDQHAIINENTSLDKYIFITGSIGVGRDATAGYTENGFIGQLREYVSDTHNLAQFSFSGFDLVEVAGTTPNLTRTMNAIDAVHNNFNHTIGIFIGVNDYLNASINATTFEGYYNDLLDEINSTYPDDNILAISATVKSTEGANGVGSTLQDYRDAIESASANRTYVRFISGLDLLNDTGQLSDGLHPTQTGHNTMFANLKTALGI